MIENIQKYLPQNEAFSAVNSLPNAMKKRRSEIEMN